MYIFLNEHALSQKFKDFCNIVAFTGRLGVGEGVYIWPACLPRRLATQETLRAHLDRAVRTTARPSQCCSTAQAPHSPRCHERAVYDAVAPGVSPFAHIPVA